MALKPMFTKTVYEARVGENTERKKDIWKGKGKGTKSERGKILPKAKIHVAHACLK